MKKLKVHHEKHYFMWEDGTPFFYLGDTAWELFSLPEINSICMIQEPEKCLSAGQMNTES